MHANPPLGLTTSACSVKLRRACVGMDEPCQSRNRDKSADCNNRCHRARQRSGVNATSLKHRRVLRWYSWLNVPIFNVPASMSPLRHEAHGARARTHVHWGPHGAQQQQRGLQGCAILGKPQRQTRAIKLSCGELATHNNASITSNFVCALGLSVLAWAPRSHRWRFGVTGSSNCVPPLPDFRKPCPR